MTSRVSNEYWLQYIEVEDDEASLETGVVLDYLASRGPYRWNYFGERLEVDRTRGRLRVDTWVRAGEAALSSQRLGQNGTLAAVENPAVSGFAGVPAMKADVDKIISYVIEQIKKDTKKERKDDDAETEE